MDLLLIADEQVSMIEKYLYRGDMFALCDDDVKAICVVTQENPAFMKLRMLSPFPNISEGIWTASRRVYCRSLQESGTELYVGTGDSPGILHFYEKCGYEKSHVVKNFFTDNYDHPMYENGKQLVDMIYLKRLL
jgi:hypothetical protein